MKTIILRNYDIYHKLLKYDTETGFYAEQLRENLSLDESENKGFYVNAGNNVVGVYASTTGSICFYNEKHFSLVNPVCYVKLNLNPEGNEFVLSWNEKTQFSVKYKPTPYQGYDNWSATNEDIDFFTWLNNNIADPTFYNYYSINQREQVTGESP